MRNLFIFVGNIGSGKSTFAKKFLQDQEMKTVCVCRDSLRYMIGCGDYIFDTELEPAIIESNLHILHEFMKLGVNILVDECNMCREYRAPYLRMADSWDYKKTALLLPKLSMEVSVDRRVGDNHGNFDREVWEGVWNKFNDMYEKPTMEEGFDEVRLVY